MRSLVCPLLSLAILSCDSTSPATPAELDVAGTWDFLIDVTVATGACAGEENDNPSTETITLTRTGTAAPYQVTASGFLGVSTNVLSGVLTANGDLALTGSYPEDGGTTTPIHALRITAVGFMAGIENWNWSGPGGTCPGSKSDVIATKQ